VVQTVQRVHSARDVSEIFLSSLRPEFLVTG
jgi:hypothetical protein